MYKDLQSTNMGKRKGFVWQIHVKCSEFRLSHTFSIQHNDQSETEALFTHKDFS